MGVALAAPWWMRWERRRSSRSPPSRCRYSPPVAAGVERRQTGLIGSRPLPAFANHLAPAWRRGLRRTADAHAQVPGTGADWRLAHAGAAARLQLHPAGHYRLCAGRDHRHGERPADAERQSGRRDFAQVWVAGAEALLRRRRRHPSTCSTHIAAQRPNSDRRPPSMAGTIRRISSFPPQRWRRSYFVAPLAGRDAGALPWRDRLDRASRARRQRLWMLGALAFPAVFVNLGHGRMDFTAALLATGLMLLDRRRHARRRRAGRARLQAAIRRRAAARSRRDDELARNASGPRRSSR